MVKSNMYSDVKTWNPAVGCGFDCVYCKPSFQRILSRFSKCELCKVFKPHVHTERLQYAKIPKGYPVIFAFGNGDLSFYPRYIIKAAVIMLQRVLEIYPTKTIYFQSKNPKVFNKLIPLFKPIKDNVVLLTTLETNRNRDYRLFSKAPLPLQRYLDFAKLSWERKIVTIEPIMDFDLERMVRWIREISPMKVYMGYNSKPQPKLPEPSTEKFNALFSELSKITLVEIKRGVSCHV